MMESSHTTTDAHQKHHGTDNHKGNTQHSVSGNALLNEIHEEEEKSLNLHWLYAVILGIAIKLGGCTIAWNYAFQIGFWEFFMGLIVIGFGYINLGLCMSELMSIISFAGGYYGYSRCALGPYFGYMVACCGIMESTFQLCVSVLKIGQFITDAFDTPFQAEPVWWFGIFNIAIVFHILCSKFFWTWISFLGLSCLMLVMIYLFGTMGYLNFDRYVQREADVVWEDNVSSFFSLFRLAVLFFIGFDMITCTSNDIANARKSMPKAVLTLISFLFILAIWLVFTVASQSPGVTKTLYQMDTYFPLTFGYQRMFHLSHAWTLFLAVIPSIATVFAYIYVIGKQVHSMAKSGLFPSWFRWTIGSEHVPWVGMLYVEVFGFLGLLYAWGTNPYTTLSRFSTLAGCLNYLALFGCYYVFHTRYSNMDRSFHNPFGLVSCGLGGFIFALIFIILILLDTQYYAITVLFLAYLVVMTIYYYLYVEAHQVFSATEQKVFFKAYVVNMKKRKKQTMQHRLWDDFVHFVNGRLFLHHFHIFSDSHSSLPDDSQSHGTTSKDHPGGGVTSTTGGGGGHHSHTATGTTGMSGTGVHHPPHPHPHPHHFHHLNSVSPATSSDQLAVPSISSSGLGGESTSRHSSHHDLKSAHIATAEGVVAAGAHSGIAGAVFHTKIIPILEGGEGGGGGEQDGQHDDIHNAVTVRHRHEDHDHDHDHFSPV